MTYDSRMFRKRIFVVTVKYDVIIILAKGFLEKCDRTVFEKVSPIDNFETTKPGIFVVARFFINFPVLSFCRT